MGFSLDQGYTPASIETLMGLIREAVNEQFLTNYTAENFVGSNHYKYFYSLIQRLQTSETKTSEIFLKLQNYFTLTNQRISRPVGTPPGLIEKFESEGFLISVKPMIDADAGKINICVDTDDAADDYDEVRLAICTLIKNSVAAGITSQGTEEETIVLTNGQAFDFKFNLPNRIDVLLRLTVTLSENNQFVIATPEEQKAKLLENIAARYRLGKNFEPQKYYNIQDDAPWAAEVLLEWSDDAGANYYDTVYDADYDDLFDTPLENITLIEA